MKTSEEKNADLSKVYTFVDIDEKSIAKVGQFPWRRDIYSIILQNLNKVYLLVLLEQKKPRICLNLLEKE